MTGPPGLGEVDDDFGPRAGSEPDDVFTWVIDDRVIATHRPGDRELRALASRGVTHVISLTVAPLDAERLREVGLRGVHIPLHDMSAPSFDEISRFVATLSSLLDAGQRVAVHCGAGLGRTGTMLACYLVSTGRSAEEAIAAVRRKRPGSVESPAQERAVRDYARRSAGGPLADVFPQ